MMITKEIVRRVSHKKIRVFFLFLFLFRSIDICGFKTFVYFFYDVV